MLKFWGNTENKESINTKTENGYNGIERRAYQRRVGADRREMVRFEPGKEDRRCGTDRRASMSYRQTISTQKVCQFN